MSINADADLMFGVVVEGCDEDGEPTMWWDEEEGDWIDIPDNPHYEMEVYGHYDASPERAIIRLKCTEQFSADCWTPTAVPLNALNGFWMSVYGAQTAFEAMFPGADVKLTDSKWWLVASYG